MKILDASLAIRRRTITSQELVERCLRNIKAQDSQAEAAFTQVHSAEDLLNQAKSVDRGLKSGKSLPQFAGIPISIKDAFDIKGELTRAGSKVLENSPVAERDATVVHRLRAAGFLIVGRTNMTEFAYSGLGVNPHFGTPLNPYERDVGRIPGGSSSGAAISVSDGMALAALGTDTGGSCRIPAALCGIVGLKPTASRVPQRGVFPLSPSLDSVGSLAQSVACCSIVDAVVSNDQVDVEIKPLPLGGLRLAVPKSLVLEDMDDAVACSFSDALRRLAGAGAVITEEPCNEFLRIPDINAKGGFAAAESYAQHRKLIADHHDDYDPRILRRILKGREQSAADYLDIVRARRELKMAFRNISSKCDALIYPTVPRIAPKLGDLVDDESYDFLNLLMLRNPAVVNLIDGCAISVPCHEVGAAPVGLMLVSEAGSDRRLLSIASSVEMLLAPKH